MKRIRRLTCVLGLLSAQSFVEAYVSRTKVAKSRRRRQPTSLQPHDDEVNKKHPRLPPVPSDLLSESHSLHLIFGVATILTLPLAALAVDHPVDHAILGIPIPVPDVRYFISGGLCAALSHGVTTPIDVVKTRIQSEPEVFNEGLLSATRAIVAQNGIGALLGGLGPTVVGYGAEGAIKFGLYESLKPTFAQFLPADDVAVAYLGASVIAGAAASLLLCPMEHTRIRLVTEPSFAKGLVRLISFLVMNHFPP